MSLDKALKALKFDVRFAEHSVQNGQMTKEELKAHRDSLPDSAAQSEPLKLDESDNSSSEDSAH